jgi:hypothetical protein
MRRCRTLMAVLTAVALSFSFGGTASASGHHAKPIKPKAGVWEAAPAGVTSYGVGGWTLSRKNGHLHMTAHPDFGGIYYPNADKCSGTYAPGLTKPDYKVSKKNTFRITDKEAQVSFPGNKPEVQHVIWKGTYFKKKQVKGTISIWITKPAKKGHKAKVVCRDMHRKWSGGTP